MVVARDCSDYNSNCCLLCKTQNINYSIGSGMFKNSDYNLDEPEELSDKDYFDKDGMLK